MSEPTPAAVPGRSPVAPAILRLVGRWAARLAVVLGGAWLGILLLGRVDAPIGPFDATVALRPLGGGASLDVPPLGALEVDAYDGPLRLEIALSRVDEIRATQLATDPVALDGLVDDVSADLRDAVERVALLTALAAVAGATTTSLLVLRGGREPLVALGLSAALVAGTAGVSAATWRPEALSQPTYTGLLVNATSLIGGAQDIVARFDAYRASLEDLVANVSTLYATVSALPPPGGSGDTVALLHVSDIHLNPAGLDLVAQVVDQFDVDAVLDTGDLTDWGTLPEGSLVARVGALGVPYVFTKGNHDSTVTVELVAAQPNATVLDDSAVTVAGIDVVGTPDPRFTPDPDADDGAQTLEETGEGLAAYVATLPRPPAVALVHDPEQAPPLDGVVPLVLAGHTHERAVTRLDGGTLLMVQGSTGGAGLRALQGEYPEPLTCTVLYLDPGTGALTAYDEITLGGLGQTEVTIEREVVGLPAAGARPAPAPASPTG
ncbi:Predicted phosphohydrolase, MPP superfamily [Geodermatophilus pulveris]|uniref:Predicted phosphohydrolase, MPP superfamily n=1 Tax=Geodermatophilus pulveris TaxID=1564159 RepID=A0A239JE40_9ACTN|nr:metallophosphoesterase [Geodermatophilus pulveris]SNT03573.1 Predicted phosphohydrolase, MPP superfamily [Geodermatophilus pulveris]